MHSSFHLNSSSSDTGLRRSAVTCKREALVCLLPVGLSSAWSFGEAGPAMSSPKSKLERWYFMSSTSLFIRDLCFSVICPNHWSCLCCDLVGAEHKVLWVQPVTRQMMMCLFDSIFNQKNYLFMNNWQCLSNSGIPVIWSEQMWYSIFKKCFLVSVAVIFSYKTKTDVCFSFFTDWLCKRWKRGF